MEIALSGCIYCGVSGKALTKEHVLPYSLHPKGQQELYIPNASCNECCIKTSAFEGRITSSARAARERLELKSYKRGRRPKRDGMMAVRRKDGSIHRISTKQAFPFFIFPYPKGMPNLLTGPRPREWVAQPVIIMPDGWPQHGEDYFYGYKTNNLDYARLYTKVAYCFAIHQCGRDYFKPIVTGFIADGVGDCLDFLGGSRLIGYHEDYYTFYLDEITLDGQKFIVSTVYYLPSLGGPCIKVIVGTK